MIKTITKHLFYEKVTSKDGEFDTYVRRPMDLSLSGKPIRAPFSPQRLEKLSEEVDDITKDPNDEKLFYNEDASKVYHESTVPTLSAKPRLDSRDSSLPVLEDNGKSNTQAEPGNFLELFLVIISTVHLNGTMARF
uniref:AGC-kinase C-terminal domain-containing protein n=1 Tax=Heterorhabditis bacteriophora TaxID=37862 RepID=A0A1I7XM44_HETBA